MPAKGYSHAKMTDRLAEMRIEPEVKNKLLEMAEENGTSIITEVRKAIDLYIKKGSLEDRVTRLEKFVYGR